MPGSIKAFLFVLMVALSMMFAFQSTNPPYKVGAQTVSFSPTHGAAGTNGTNGSTYLKGSTGSIGGGLLLAAGCTSGSATVTGATTAMTALASPVTYPGDGGQYQAYVSAPNTVTVKLCAILALTPTASVYRVSVFP